jgi:hypothetical protein
MRQSLDVLRHIQIASPCSVPWDSMVGDNRSRHCAECDLTVHNFAAMTTVEVLTLIHSTDGRLCGRLYRRADGTILTSDCPVGLRLRMKRAWRRATAYAASMLAAILTIGCARSDTASVATQKIKWITEDDPPCAVPGKIVFTPPPAPVNPPS